MDAEAPRERMLSGPLPPFTTSFPPPGLCPIHPQRKPRHGVGYAVHAGVDDGQLERAELDTLMPVFVRPPMARISHPPGLLSGVDGP